MQMSENSKDIVCLLKHMRNIKHMLVSKKLDLPTTTCDCNQPCTKNATDARYFDYLIQHNVIDITV